MHKTSGPAAATAPPIPAGGRTVEVFGNAMMPLYRHGDRLIVSHSAPMRAGDRIVVESAKQGTIGGILLHCDKSHVSIIMGGNARRAVQVDRHDLRYIGRVIWASQ